MTVTTDTPGLAPPPVLDRRMLEAILAKRLPEGGARRLLLVYARYREGSVEEFTVEDRGVHRKVVVTDQSSVLGIVDAWQRHRIAHPDDTVLVITTAVDTDQLGWDIRANAVVRRTDTVDPATIVAHRFGATDVDPRLRTRSEGWLVDALLAAEPTAGWRRGSGGVLTRDVAIRALIGARLGLAIGDGQNPDAETLFAWLCDTAGPSRFAALGPAEQDGLARWLTDTAGVAVGPALAFAAAGRADEALALGLVADAVTRPGASAQAALAFGGLLGSVRLAAADLRAFAAIVRTTLEHWVNAAFAGGPGAKEARRRVLTVVDRADELVSDTDLVAELADDDYLPSGYRSRRHALAAALTAHADPTAAAMAERALGRLWEHYLVRLSPEGRGAEEMAVRLVRWLAQPSPLVGSVAAGIRDQATEWGWVDRALAVVWAGDKIDDPVVAHGYQTVHDAVRARRDAVDESFATHLAAWAPGAATQAPGGCLLIEDVLSRVVRPLAENQPPLLIVLDGMSAAVAADLGEELAATSWLEVVPKLEATSAGHRVAAVAAIPSVTTVSRASLLAGAATAGDQGIEQAGFAAFWRGHRRDAKLFHKGTIGGHAGRRLSDSLVDALAGDSVVGVVLNTIDDALDHGREGDRAGWRLAEVTHLPELLAAARSYGRPVVLVGDHGHVLERGPVGEPPTAASGVESARWRTGNAGPGEVELAGPRVLAGGGRIVAPWRERIRYTPRKAGYHGGAALAEMAVPLIVLLPAVDLLPAGWAVLPPEAAVPSWWAPPRASLALGAPALVPPAKTLPPKKPGKKPAAQEPALFPVESLPAAPPQPQGLGAGVVAAGAYTAQLAHVRKPPDRPVVAAVIDALATAGGSLSLTAVAAQAGRAGRNPEFFAAILQRLLNVEGYPVVSLVDAGRTLSLNVELLRLQFGLDSSP